MFQPSVSDSTSVRQGLMVSVLALAAILYSPLPQHAVHQASAGILTLVNNGDSHFTVTVRAPSFVEIRSERLKDNIDTLRDARLAIQQLRGVRFSRKNSGNVSLGVIAA